MAKKVGGAKKKWGAGRIFGRRGSMKIGGRSLSAKSMIWLESRSCDVIVMWVGDDCVEVSGSTVLVTAKGDLRGLVVVRKLELSISSFMLRI
jgi:hypothetical protein